MTHTQLIHFVLAVEPPIMDILKSGQAVLSLLKYIYSYIQVENHYFEMKGDLGMSSHEKEREQEDAFTQTQTH